MKRLILATAALALSGCTTPTLGDSVAPIETVSVQPTAAARYFGAAERTYIVAAEAAIVAVDLGIIRGSTATQVRQLNARARTVIVTGKAATDLSAARELFVIAGRLNTLAGSN